jgi:hypothetical protein
MMDRRKFLKSMFAAGILLTPIPAFIKALPVPDPVRDLASASSDECLHLPYPYIIQIENRANTSAANAEIWGGFKYIDARRCINSCNDNTKMDACKYADHEGFVNDNELKIGDVVVSSGMPDIPYKRILLSSMMNPFNFDKMLLEFSNPEQAREKLKLISTNANGNSAELSIVPLYHTTPYDIDHSAIMIENSAFIDGFTTIRFMKLLPGKINIRLYPSIKPSMKFNSPDRTFSPTS